MRIAIPLSYAGDFEGSARQVVELEKAGLDLVWVAEAYGFDAVSFMGYLAAKTDTVAIGSGILPLYTRTPTLLAMTAAGVDALSGGRCVFGLGASGPQVIEGFHGVAYDKPIGRTREIIDICRKVWKREVPLTHDGPNYHLPLPEGQGTGLGKPLKILAHPVRESIPIFIASLGEKNVSLTAEVADGWLPVFFIPEKAGDVFGPALDTGQAKRSPDLDTLDICAGGLVAITDDADHAASVRDLGRAMAALYIGGMGARGRNFYNDLACRYGYDGAAKEIQDLYLDGKKQEAAAKVPYDLLQKTSLIGAEGFVRDRLAALKESGVTTLNVTPIAGDHAARVKLVEKVRELAASV